MDGIMFGTDATGPWASVGCRCGAHTALRPVQDDDTHLMLLGEVMLQAHQTGWTVGEAGFSCADCAAGQGRS